MLLPVEEKQNSSEICNLRIDVINSHIIWLNRSMLKRNILIGSLSGPNFAIRTAKIDRSQTDFDDLCS